MRFYRDTTRGDLEMAAASRGLCIRVVRQKLGPDCAYREFYAHQFMTNDFTYLGRVSKGVRPNWDNMIRNLPGPKVIHTLSGQFS